MRFSVAAFAFSALVSSAVAEFSLLSLPASSASVAECSDLILFWIGEDADTITINAPGSVEHTKLNATEAVQGFFLWSNDVVSGNPFTLSLNSTLGAQATVVWGDINGAPGTWGTTFTSTPGSSDCY